MQRHHAKVETLSPGIPCPQKEEEYRRSDSSGQALSKAAEGREAYFSSSSPREGSRSSTTVDVPEGLQSVGETWKKEIAEDSVQHFSKVREQNPEHGNQLEDAVLKHDRRKTIPSLQREDASLANQQRRLSWTACYDDSCQTHLGEKEGASFFPRKPNPASKRRRGEKQQQRLEAKVAAERDAKNQNSC